MWKIQFYNEDFPVVEIDKKRTGQYLRQLIKEEGKKVFTISVIFCSDNYLLNINKEYLNHDYFTDVITFDYCEKGIISGDIFMSIERIKENSKKYGEPFNRELYRVLFHGVLHLIGYNDKTEEEIGLMREREKFYLNKFIKE